ncbi:MAG: SDR family oxidoreductase, partial [Pseudomonadota bacterium]
MTAVTRPMNDVVLALREAGIDVGIANDNGPRQVVLSGTLEVIERAEMALRDRGFDWNRIAVSTAFHSPVVSAARDPFRDFLANIDFMSTSKPVYSNLDAGIYPDNAEVLRTNLADQIVSRVRFREMVENMYAAGVRTFVEVGPGNVLTRLVEQILAVRTTSSMVVNLDRKEQNGLTALWHGLGRLAAAGHALKFEALWSGYGLEPERPDSIPQYAIPINGTNYGRPYPERKFDPLQRPRLTPRAQSTMTAPIDIPKPAPMASPSPTLSESSLRSLGDAHAAMQRALSDGHASYLRAMESSFTALCRATGTPSASAVTMPDPVAMPSVATHTTIPERMMSPPVPVVVTPAAEVVAPAIPAAPDIGKVLISIVAEKTGYPMEMLKPGMSLEGDLGIDSIKRVEIFSALSDHMPSLPRLSPADIVSLRTLEQITEHLKNLMPGIMPAILKVVEVSQKPVQECAKVVRAVVVEAIAKSTGHSIFADKTSGRVVVTEDGEGVRDPLIERLRHAGFEVQPDGAVSAEDDVVIFLGGLRTVHAPEDAFAVIRECFATARIVATRMSQRGGIFVTVQDTGGDFGLSGHAGNRAWLAGLAGLTKTAALEWPSASVKAIDVARGERSASDVAAAIVVELLNGGAEIEVGLHADGRRTTLTALPSTGTIDTFQLRPQSVVVVSGGARGVTVAALQALARVVPLRMVLIGRTTLNDEPECVKNIEGETGIKRALSTGAEQGKRVVSFAEIGRLTRNILAAREVRAGIASLEQLGCEVRYVAQDVRDRAAVETALDEVRRTWGPIVAVIHAAGVLADRDLAEKTEEQFERVFSTKVMGLRILLEATHGD